MSNAVWIIISIPTAEREKQLWQEQQQQQQQQNHQNFPDSNTIKSNGNLLPPHINSNHQTTNGLKPFKKLLEDSFDELNIQNVVWNINRNGRGYQVFFACDLEESDSILEYFASKRIGSHKETYIGYVQFNTMSLLAFIHKRFICHDIIVLSRVLFSVHLIFPFVSIT